MLTVFVHVKCACHSSKTSFSSLSLSCVSFSPFVLSLSTPGLASCLGSTSKEAEAAKYIWKLHQPSHPLFSFWTSISRHAHTHTHSTTDRKFPRQHQSKCFISICLLCKCVCVYLWTHAESKVRLEPHLVSVNLNLTSEWFHKLSLCVNQPKHKQTVLTTSVTNSVTSEHSQTLLNSLDQLTVVIACLFSGFKGGGSQQDSQDWPAGYQLNTNSTKQLNYLRTANNFRLFFIQYTEPYTSVLY